MVNKVDDLKNNPTWCPLPWLNLNTNTDGRCKLCCAINENKHIQTDSGEDAVWGENSIDEIWNSQYMKEVRQRMSNGDPVDACQICYDLEDMGLESSRTHSIRQYIEEDSTQRQELENRIEETECTDGYLTELPNMLELRLGNHCNLKCNSCWSMSSSKILNERSKQLETGNVPNDLFAYHWNAELNSVKGINFYWHESETFINDLERLAPTLYKLYMTGGEPTLIKANDKLVEYMYEVDNNDCHISFTTNMTYWNQPLYDKLQLAPWSEVQVSMDGYGKVNEYIRFGSSWEKVSQNFEKLLSIASGSNITIKVYSVIQALNLWEIDNLLLWLDNKASEYSVIIDWYPIFLDYPPYLHTYIWPQWMRDSAADNLVKQFRGKEPELFFFQEGLEKLIKFYRADFNEKEIFGDYIGPGTDQGGIRYQFFEYCSWHDKIRGTDFCSTFKRHFADWMKLHHEGY